MSTPVLRLVRPIQDSPAIFLRPGHNDHKLLCQLISEGRAGIAGAVFDPAFVEEQEDLRNAINQRNLWSVLDPRALELSTQGGLTPRRRTLPWAPARPHVPTDLTGQNAKTFAALIVDFVLEHGYTGLLAPTHYLAKGFADPWLNVDLELYENTRSELKRRNAEFVSVYYPLCLPTRSFFDPAQRLAIKSAMKTVHPADALWLRVHPFGSSSGHVTLENYIRSARDLQDLGVPLVGEKVGSVGTALLSFGALGGVEIGVSSGESFDFNRLLKKASGKGFAPHRGILLEGLGISLDPKRARVFFDNRTLRGNYACRNTDCCRQGHTDTLKEPRRHFVLAKLNEASQIGTAPFQDRPSFYLERFLRPATDKLGRVAQTDVPKTIKEKVEREQRRLSGWRNTLGQLSTVPLMSAAKVPAKRIAQLRGAA